MEKLLTKTILILSAGLEAIPIIQKAKSMGCYVVVLDGYESAPGIKYADDLIISSTFDVAGSVEKAKNYSQNKRTLDGVMSAGHDAPHTVAHIAHALALAGVPVATAEMAVDKVAMKDKFAKDGVAIPWYSSVDDFQHAENGGEFKVLGYFVDGYDKNKNTVIEVLEKYHSSPKQQKRDIMRKKEIKECLGCKFIEVKLY